MTRSLEFAAALLNPDGWVRRGGEHEWVPAEETVFFTATSVRPEVVVSVVVAVPLICCAYALYATVWRKRRWLAWLATALTCPIMLAGAYLLILYL